MTSPVNPPPKVPPVQVAPSRDFKPSALSKTQMVPETIEVMKGPGDTLNLSSGHKFREVREKLDGGVPYTGMKWNADGTVTAQDVPNPDSPDGKWDPYAFMPRFAFDPKEDAFPVSPSFDGDTDLANNAGVEAGGEGAYKDGSVGGDQPLTAGFTVTKKGEYTVLTYSFYYAHNKAMDYHQNDYSTAQVYLKPGPDGKLAPTHLAASWHHGSILTPWKDLAKDANGSPVVKVHIGSHALQPVGAGDEWEEGGLNLAGNGEAIVDGKAIGQKLTFDAFQPSVANANVMPTDSPEGRLRLKTMEWGEAAKHPFLPEVYERHGKGPLRSLVERGLETTTNKAKDALGGARAKGGELLDGAKDLAGDAKDLAGNAVDKGGEAVDKVEDLAGGAVDKGKDLVGKLEKFW